MSLCYALGLAACSIALSVRNLAAAEEMDRLFDAVVGNVASFRKRLTGRKKDLYELERSRRRLQFHIEGPNRLEHGANHCPPMRELFLLRRSFPLR
jgi:hypothetical protein